MNEATRNNILTIKEAASYAKVGRDRIVAAINSGEIRFIDLGERSKRITTAELDRWMAKKTVKEIRQ